MKRFGLGSHISRRLLPTAGNVNLMALSNRDQESIRDYLLGHLNDEELGKVEERLMVDDEFFEELEISKGELIEAYTDGQLTAKDHEWFEGHYLASSEGRQRQAFWMAIDCLKAATPAPAPQPPSFLDNLRSIFMTRPWALAAPVVVVLIIVAVFQLPSRPQQVVSLNLENTATYRDEGPLPSTVDLSNARELRLSLALPKAFTPGVSYRAELDNRTDKRSLTAVSHDNTSVTTVIPAGDLPRGEYAVTLTVVMADGSERSVPGSYRFNVE